MIPLILGGLSAAGSIASAITGNKRQKEANKARQQALDFEKQRWAGGQPFRDAGTAMLQRQMNPAAITQMYARPENPFAAQNQYIDPWQTPHQQAPAAPQAAPVVDQRAKLKAAVMAMTKRPRGPMGV